MKPWVFALSMLAASAGPSAAELIHATWGGGGAAVLRDYFQVQFTQKTGIAARMAEVPNTAGAVRSPSASQYNVVEVTYFEAIGLAKSNLLEAFEDKEIPAIADLPKELVVRNKDGRIVGLATHFGYYGIAFNNTLAKASDFQSWNDLTAPRWKGKLAVTRPVYATSYDLTILAHANGGGAAKIEPGIEPLKAIFTNALTTYTSLAHMNTLLTRGEITAAPFYSTRVWSLRRDGQKTIEMAIPKEGALMLPYVVVVPKGSAERAQTIAYLNELLDAAAQTRISGQNGSIPTNNRAVLPPEYEQDLGMTREALMKKMYIPDWNVIVSDYEDRLNRVEQIAAGKR
ncbi:extracellular solute-binding protein [Bosea sp. ASV33]|uniref:ABC transporter substrate-binding protein n=1 Tax=Bosea sp. ASV33 TaxID=2795106 RepID=UPI0018EBF8A5|nr:extracellular solute-binding protein [Bosea sp. ASV33]